ncbi:MAG TPA: hypothetical protein PKD91_12215, partial [Bacteroidia bacterium]|nr:hypothetical protein [Bacteroidia bacterium]
MKKHILVLALTFIPLFVSGQKRGNVWCFGHGASIDFNGSVPVNDSSALISRGSCASICDTNGQLLFYSGYDDDQYSIFGPPFQNGEIFTSQHTTMQNGDSIVMQLWYYENVIIPFPKSDSIYYVFSIGETNSSFKGFFYSIIDMSLNGGLGGVIQKNVQLQNFKCTDGITAIKHGNGRDWWVVFKRWDFNNNTLYKYLITPSGISNTITQNIGTSTANGFAKMKFSPEGNKMALLTLTGLFELYDFDRCTGLLSNPYTVFPEQSFPYSHYFWDGQFSPSGNIFYTTSSWDTSRFIQYDLQAANIPSSADTLWQTNTNINQFGQVKLAPDNKIYLTTWYANGFQFPFPYADTMTNVYNSYLSVVNQPDSMGGSCDFQPYSFYLGGKRTYLGLPNNPDYDMPALAGSPCDTLVGISEASPSIINPQLNLFYHPQWQTAFINAQKLTGSNYRL